MAVGADPEPGAVPDEEFDAIARAVAEDVEMSRGGIGLKFVFYDRVKPVEAFAHVSVTGDDEDAGGGAEGDHVRAWKVALPDLRLRDLGEDLGCLLGLAADEHA